MTDYLVALVAMRVCLTSCVCFSFDAFTLLGAGVNFALGVFSNEVREFCTFVLAKAIIRGDGVKLTRTGLSVSKSLSSLFLPKLAVDCDALISNNFCCSGRWLLKADRVSTNEREAE